MFIKTLANYPFQPQLYLAPLFVVCQPICHMTYQLYQIAYLAKDLAKDSREHPLETIRSCDSHAIMPVRMVLRLALGWQTFHLHWPRAIYGSLTFY